jgi:hypothetical protein
VPDGGSLVVLGLGPIGDMACRIAAHRGHRVIGVDLVPKRLDRVRGRGIEVLDLTEHDDLPGTIREMTDGRGPESVIDAVGMEAHGSPVAGIAHKLAGLLPDKQTRSAWTRSPPPPPPVGGADAYEHFQHKEEGMVKVVFNP